MDQHHVETARPFTLGEEKKENTFKKIVDVDVKGFGQHTAPYLGPDKQPEGWVVKERAPRTKEEAEQIEFANRMAQRAASRDQGWKKPTTFALGENFRELSPDSQQKTMWPQDNSDRGRSASSSSFASYYSRESEARRMKEAMARRPMRMDSEDVASQTSHGYTAAMQTTNSVGVAQSQQGTVLRPRLKSPPQPTTALVSPHEGSDPRCRKGECCGD
jgi:hypothetical protein